MIRQFRLENFKGHRDTQLLFERFTMLVGDNGSGKTSVLEALRLLGAISTQFDSVALEEVLCQGAVQMQLSADGTTHGEPWESSLSFDMAERNATMRVSGVDLLGRFDNVITLQQSHAYADELRRVTNPIGRVALYRFRSDQIAASAYSDQPGVAVAEDGAQTAVVLAALKLADDEAFDRIEDAMRTVVPSLSRLRIGPAKVVHPSNPNPVVGSKLYFDFLGAKNVPAHHASQGTLVALALLTVLLGPNCPRVVLLDDFDHSLHPRAQMELVRMIKQLLEQDEFKETQIIATTHSPYVLDEMSPSSVIAFALRDDGSVASKPLSEHPDAPEVSGALKAGELWTLDAERDWVR